MPYKKSYKRRSRRRYGRAHSALDIASKSLAVAYGVKRLMNVEQKFLDTQGTGTEVPNAAGVIVQLTNVAQGDTDQTRDGAQIKLMSFSFKANVSVDASGSASGTLVSVFLIEDKQTNSAIYTTANLLVDATAGDSLVSPLNLDNKFRFRVIKRWKSYVNLTGKSSFQIDYYKRFGNNMKIRYDGNAGDITDLASKSLSLLFISSEATNTPQVTFHARLRYVDN